MAIPQKKEWRHCEAPGCIHRIGLTELLCLEHTAAVEPMHLEAVSRAEEEMAEARRAYIVATERLAMALARLRGALPAYCRRCHGSCLYPAEHKRGEEATA